MTSRYGDHGGFSYELRRILKFLLPGYSRYYITINPFILSAKALVQKKYIMSNMFHIMQGDIDNSVTTFDIGGACYSYGAVVMQRLRFSIQIQQFVDASWARQSTDFVRTATLDLVSKRAVDTC